MPAPNLVVAEDDPFLRIVQLVLDPKASPERHAAYADFFAHDEPDFAGWCARVRADAAGLYPAEVRMVETQEDLRAHLADCRAVIVEGLTVGTAEIAAAPRLKAVQKYGVILRTIDAAGCAARNIPVLTLRRRANIACAELALTFMLMLARKVHVLQGRITAEQLAAIGYRYKPFDRRHTANSNYGRVPGLRILHGGTLGIIGLGEIGRELALRAGAFGMRILYTQRTRLPEAEERHLQAHYRPLDALLAESDWVVPLVPGGPNTRHLIDGARLAQMKPGAGIVNVSRAEVIERTALIAALKSGRLAGFALDPLYEEPGRSDDELQLLPNVILTPHIAAQPRLNALDDLYDMITGLARATAP
jgi:phosphoglycerate dehydrogenase-like enzyme